MPWGGQKMLGEAMTVALDNRNLYRENTLKLIQ